MTHPTVPHPSQATTMSMLAGPDNAARRTGAAMIASGLAVLPLRQVFTDWSWLPDVWGAILLTLGPAALLRMRAPARSIHLLPGLVITTCYLTVRFVPDHAWAGLLPLHGTWSDISTLITSFGDTIRDSSAPLHSTPAIRLMVAVQLTLLAVVIDLLAVVARRPALAGVPFLLLFTIAGAVPRHAVGWVWFAFGAVGYLLLLGSDTRDDILRWGRLMPRNVAGSRAAVKALSARRIGVIAIVIAVAVPLLLPVRSSNVLADALHGGTGGSGKGGVSLSPFASLKGQLNRKNPETLFKVTTNGLGADEPFYLSQVILDQYNSAGWRQGDDGASQPLDSTEFAAEPPSDRPNFVTYSATITIDNLDDNEAPIFQSPTNIDGLSSRWGWSPRNEVVVGARTNKGDRYTEDVAEPRPSENQLAQARTPADQSAVRHWLQMPANLPPRVRTLVKQLTENAATPYARTRAIFDFFSTANSFSYSTATKSGDSGSDLEDFLLVSRTGFCQQYAAAMSIMLRMADVPSRVVLGYTHPKPDKNGTFSVTTSDAHAWVEAYFAGIGWVPFDPTPLVGVEAARSVGLPWAPHANSTLPNAASSAPTGTDLGRDQPSKGLSVAAGGQDTNATSNGGLPLWAVWLMIAAAVIVVGLALLPAAARMARRRSRIRAAAHGPDPLWQELADTAVDLGYVWSDVRSPRQVVRWLKREGLSDNADHALRTLAGAVEFARYAAPGQTATKARTSMVEDLKLVEGSLRSRRNGWERTRARMLPESLGWVRRVQWRGRH